MRVDGQCHCGAISYAAVVDPDSVSLCHCSDCQVLTGCAFRVSVRAAAPTFVLRGTPTIYIKTAESGRRRAHAFCGTCGSPIYSAPLQSPDAYTLRVGSLRQRFGLRPSRQIWCRSGLPWSMNVEAIEKVERQ